MRKSHMGPEPKDAADRFWAKVDMSGGDDACWPWLGGRSPRGYGNFFVGSVVDGTRRSVRAARFSYDLTHPDAPLGRRVCRHACDNPPCCNPRHLKAGEQADNVADMYERGRHVVSRGAQRTNAVLTEQLVRDVRRFAAGGVSQRKIAARLSVSRPTIQAVLSRRNWKHVA